MVSLMNTIVTMNVTEVTSDLSDLDRWNEQMALRLTPNNVILSLYILFGLFGNAVVFLTYSLQSNLQNQERYFIPKLALADLFASTICATLGIVWNFMQAKFENEFLCIVGNFFVVTTQSVSLFLLFIISVQRYLKVCKHKDMSLRIRRSTLIIIIIFCIALGVWSTFNFRIKPFVLQNIPMTGFRCKLVKNKNGGGMIFGAALLVSIVAVITSMLVMYGKIAHKIATHVKRVRGTISKQESIEMSEDSHRDLSNANTNSKSRDITVLEDVENLTLPECSKESSSITEKCNVPIRKIQHQKPKRKRNIGHRFTIMFMLISVVFIVCYVTKTVLMLLESLDPRFWDSMSDDKRAGVLFLYRIYIVNSIVNPFIYAFLDARFSEELKKMYITCKLNLRGIFCLHC